jgi:hypothetical protein
MLSVAWQGRIAVGRFLYIARAMNALKFVDIIEQECKGAVTIPKIRRCVFMIVCFSCCFYALFLFDTLGDTTGFGGSYWVLIALPLLPVGLYIAHQVRARWLRRRLPQPRDLQRAADAEEDERSVEMRKSAAAPATTGAAAGGAAGGVDEDEEVRSSTETTGVTNPLGKNASNYPPPLCG